jgi:hypothetical protein
LEVQTTITQAEVVPGEKIDLHYSAIVHSPIPVRWVGSHPFVNVGAETSAGAAKDLVANQSSSQSADIILPANTPLTQPYWLRSEGTPGMFRVDDPTLIGTPENAPALPIENIFEVGGQTLVVSNQPVQLTTDAAGQEIRRQLDVIPPVSLRFISDITLFAPGKSRTVTVAITASRPGSAGTLSLDAPAGWGVLPAGQSFQLAQIGDEAMFNFTVTAPSAPGTAKIIADAEISGVHYRNAREQINYPHIPRQLLQPLARLKAVSLDLATRGHLIGYLPGAGDSLAENLQQMGYAVKTLDGAELTAEQLRGLDAIVIGVRAFNVRNDLADKMPLLFGYVENGGTLIAQYNRPDGLKVNQIAPYDLHLSGDRVTDETATMTFLAPDHPVLNTPNKITNADFDGWVQERGIYFPNQWDDHFTPIFACHDPGDAPLKGSLLVAQYGKGYFVYTGLDFFRELPAGVPGAYRLFANLISLGK